MSSPKEPLIEKARAGDARAFEALVREHQARVRAYLAACVHRQDVVDDLAQEVFLTAFRTLDTFRGDAPLGAWLLGIARHRALMHLRSESVRRQHDPVAGALAAAQLARVEGDGQVAREQELLALQRCLEGLPPASAALVRRHYFEARPLLDLATAEGKREGTLRVTMFRLRKALRACVQRRLEGQA